MDLNEITRVLWRRKLVASVVFALVLAAGAGSLYIQPEVYTSTATLGLTPSATSDDNPLFLLSQIDAVAPLYAEAVTARDTREAARRQLPANAELGEVEVRTFRDAALILKVSVRASTPEAAQASAEAHVDALLDRARRGEIGLPGMIEVLRVDAPGLPTEPVSPRPRVTMIISIVLAIGFAVGAGLVLDTLRRAVDEVDGLAHAAGVPVFGEIPIERAIARLRSTNELLESPALRTVAEAIRDIRTNLQFSVDGFSPLLITSPEGSHGKTTVAFSLAVVLARSGASTLLVDGDLRRGRIDEMLSDEGRPFTATPGLRDVLKGMPPAGAIQPTKMANLVILTCGRTSEDPSELLESSFLAVLRRLEHTYDMVIVDGPPLMPINDARIMARHVRSTLLVVNAGTVTRRQVRQAAERLRIIGTEPTAAVLNGSRVRHKASHYRYLGSRPEAS